VSVIPIVSRSRERNFWESGERKHLVFASFINKKWKKVGFYGGKCKTYIIEKRAPKNSI
jgi:hypothetical protein